MSILDELLLLKSEIDNNEFEIEKTQIELETETKIYIKIKEEMSIHEEVLVILKTVVEKISKEHFNTIENLLNTGLSLIFPDRVYRVKIKVEEKRGLNSVTFMLLEDIGDDVIISLPLSKCGGSISTIIGFLLQLFYINYFKLERLMFIDEAFTTLADVNGLIDFMRQLSEKKGFVFVLISHDPRLQDLVDNVYVVDGRGVFKRGSN